MEIYKIDQLKKLIQDTHVNFLMGSGLSRPFLSVLGPIETLVTKAQDIKDDFQWKIVESSLFSKYFTSVMEPCSKIDDHLTEDEISKLKVVIGAYSEMLTTWTSIMAKRSSSLLDKTINIFTTNIDNILERVGENLKLEFNDGFRGHLRPTFHEDSFSKVISKVSSHYQNSSQIPIFNYLKIHGSINWKRLPESEAFITYDHDLELISEIKEAIKFAESEHTFIPIDTKIKDCDEGIENLRKYAEEKINSLSDDESKIVEEALDRFNDAYFKLIMIHPRKTKFKESVLDMHFYELMRIYSNTLEVSGTSLFVLGFSFADEHLAQLTIRAANSNPTLQILVFAYDENGKADIIENLKRAGVNCNNNIKVISPLDFYNAQDNNMREFLREQGFVVACSSRDDKSANDATDPENATQVSNATTKEHSDGNGTKESSDNMQNDSKECPLTVFSLDNINQYVFKNIERLIF